MVVNRKNNKKTVKIFRMIKVYIIMRAILVLSISLLCRIIISRLDFNIQKYNKKINKIIVIIIKKLLHLIITRECPLKATFLVIY